MGNWKKWMLNAAILVIIFSLIVYYIFNAQDPRVLLRLMDMANGWYWIAGIILVILFISCESLIIRLLLSNTNATPTKGHCLIYSFIGFFFSAITPAAGGGQPAQIYYMNKDGLNPGITTPILAVVTAGYKMVLVIYGLIVLVLQPAEIFMANDIAVVWVVAGLALNIIVIVLFIIAVFKPVLLEYLLHLCLKLTNLFLSTRKSEKLDEKISYLLSNYNKSAECIKSNPKLMIMVIIISFIQRSIHFAITWLVLISFNITGYSLIYIIVMQSMVSLGTDLLPLPGGSGANEALFLLLFGSICGDQLVVPVMIASRGISFYAQLVICGLVTIVGIRKINQIARSREVI